MNRDRLLGLTAALMISTVAAFVSTSTLTHAGSIDRGAPSPVTQYTDGSHWG